MQSIHVGGKSAAAGRAAAPASGGMTVGDHVAHKAFGQGVIQKTTPMGNDTLLEIKFDKVGVKKIMQNFAKLEKV